MRTLPHDLSLAIPPCPVALRPDPRYRFVPAAPPRATRRAMRDFTGFLALAWAVAELALWVGA
ncbi:hypothetical protein GXW78_22030 [Roseomonas terrae]|uniref:Uncharacterized protein n=1 Tax=Neoroseomonas terrae TaxID=424799 RepID=A0ABS5EMU9_9PROT|nr:hypothetical protein [Neoroseomonas terrae]MBR0652352.1 hypothetical protein [Neoroseomonas terrae]